MSVDSRLLIKQVEARPAIWNRNDKNYGDKQFISKLWEEISLVQGVHESKVKSKWKALRDTFRQELKKHPQQSIWNYYMDMHFIKGQFKTSKPAIPGEPGFENDLDETIFVKKEPEESSSYSQESFVEESRGEPDKNEDEMGCEWADAGHKGGRRKMIPDTEDDDYHFLMSLLPEMRKLDPRQKLLLRLKIMALFYKEVHQNQ